MMSCYCYAQAVHHLLTLNQERGNAYQQANEPLPVWSWPDVFPMGNVYAVGFGSDASELDLRWAIERKARENAACGSLQAALTQSNGKTRHGIRG